MRVRTEAIQFKADQKLIDYIEKRLQKMPQFFDRIIEIKVTLKLENSGRGCAGVGEPGQTVNLVLCLNRFESYHPH
jgi:ribosome-associated translation inhibitor RaiA